MLKTYKDYNDTETVETLLIEYGIATEQEIHLVTMINGWNVETMNDILYARTGYRDMEQYDDQD